MMVQRYMSATSQREAAKALTLSGVFVFLQFCLFLYIGIALATYFTRFPPETPFARGDQVFAAFIVHDLPRGVGLVGTVVGRCLFGGDVHAFEFPQFLGGLRGQ